MCIKNADFQWQIHINNHNNERFAKNYMQIWIIFENKRLTCRNFSKFVKNFFFIFHSWFLRFSHKGSKKSIDERIFACVLIILRLDEGFAAIIVKIDIDLTLYANWKHFSKRFCLFAVNFRWLQLIIYFQYFAEYILLFVYFILVVNVLKYYNIYDLFVIWSQCVCKMSSLYFLHFRLIKLCIYIE